MIWVLEYPDFDDAFCTHLNYLFNVSFKYTIFLEKWYYIKALLSDTLIYMTRQDGS
jgi:hypothetical protein